MAFITEREIERYEIIHSAFMATLFEFNTDRNILYSFEFGVFCYERFLSARFLLVKQGYVFGPDSGVSACFLICLSTI